MLSTLSSFQSQLASIMETLVQTAVLEISKLVDAECELLLSELKLRAQRNSPRSTERHTGTSTVSQNLTALKSEHAQEEMQNHLNGDSNEVLFRVSPTVLQRDQDSPLQNCEVNQPISMIKQELHEVDIWIGQGSSEAGTHSGEAVSQSPIKEAFKMVPHVERNSRENGVPSAPESPELNRNTSPGEIMLNQKVQLLSKKCTSESLNASFSLTQSLSASKSTRTCVANTISGEKRLVCTYCSKWFRCFSQLAIHQRSHTGEKPYRCTLCGKRYIQKGHLDTHQRTHTGEKPYRCTLCGKGFIQKCTRDMHLRSHTGEKPYTCTKCGKGLTTKFNLKKHLSGRSCSNIR